MVFEEVVRAVVETVIGFIIAAIELELLRSVDFDFEDSVEFAWTLIIMGFTDSAKIEEFLQVMHSQYEYI